MPPPDALHTSHLIAGFGAAGCALALALVQKGVPPAQILLLANPNPREFSGPDARILALHRQSERFLVDLGVWDALAPAACPMRSIALTDSHAQAQIRPLLLALEPQIQEGPPTGFQEAAQQEGRPTSAGPLAYMVALSALEARLQHAVRAAGITILADTITAFEAKPEGISASLASGAGVQAQVLIAADGAASPLRGLAGIPSYGWPYHQTAIAAILRHSRPHHGEALQHFLPEGPFALLPLADTEAPQSPQSARLGGYRSALVWSAPAQEAQDFLAGQNDLQGQTLPAGEKSSQITRLEALAAGWRGDILAIEALSSHPLRLALARDYIAPRLALLADAAHVVHPLAGQGLNLGLMDAQALAHILAERYRLGLDAGGAEGLQAYQAARRPAAMAMAMATEGIHRLFANDNPLLRLARGVGAGLIARTPMLQRALLRAAASRTAGGGDN